MKRQRRLSIIYVVLLLFGPVPQGATMPNQKTLLEFVPLKMEEVGNVKSVRLVSEKDKIYLAALMGSERRHEHRVSMSSYDGTGAINRHPNKEFNLDSPFGVPSWDIAFGQAGFSTVWTMPGSAFMPLAYRTHGGEEMVIAGRDPGGVFHVPRFVRGAMVTAITSVSQGNTLVLFQNAIESGHAPYKPLPSTGPGLLAGGLLLQVHSGYVLLSKLVGGPRGPARRDVGGESLDAGTLRCLYLNAKFQAVGAALSPLGAAEIYEFDADISGDKVFLLATTAKGYMTAVGTVSTQSIVWMTSSDMLADGDLFSPSILASEKTAIAAVIEFKVEYQSPPSRQLLMGRFQQQ
jgi:hypothetical protein